LGTSVKNAVITVPAYFNDSQRQVGYSQLFLLYNYSWWKSYSGTVQYDFSWHMCMHNTCTG